MKNNLLIFRGLLILGLCSLQANAMQFRDDTYEDETKKIWTQKERIKASFERAKDPFFSATVGIFSADNTLEQRQFNGIMLDSLHGITCAHNPSRYSFIMEMSFELKKEGMTVIHENCADIYKALKNPTHSIELCENYKLPLESDVFGYGDDFGLGNISSKYKNSRIDIEDPDEALSRIKDIVDISLFKLNKPLELKTYPKIYHGDLGGFSTPVRCFAPGFILSGKEAVRLLGFMDIQYNSKNNLLYSKYATPGSRVKDPFVVDKKMHQLQIHPTAFGGGGIFCKQKDKAEPELLSIHSSTQALNYTFSENDKSTQTIRPIYDVSIPLKDHVTWIEEFMKK